MSALTGLLGLRAVRRTRGVTLQRSLLAWSSSSASHSTAHRGSTTPAVSALDAYQEAVQRARIDPEGFWAEIASDLVWHKPWKKVLDNSNAPFAKWFVGGEINACYNAVDRHVDDGIGDRVAIVHDSPVTKSVTKVTYSQLKQKVSVLASALSKLGVNPGDRVLIYMPMVPEAIVAMLATARLGAVHSLVFGGFAAKELASRIKHAEPKVVVTANCGIEPSRVVSYHPIVNEALSMCGNPPVRCIFFQRPGYDPAPLSPQRDLSWDAACDLGSSGPAPDCVPVDANDPLYILYTSGTTGNPKGVQRPIGGHITVLPWSLRKAYNMSPGDVWWAASDLGWVVGHSYICYAPLINANTSILYEGKPVGTPDAAQFFRVINEHGVKGLFAAPTSLRAIKKEDPNGDAAKRYAINSLKHLFVAGENCDWETLHWAGRIFRVPPLDNWWQTESGHPITVPFMGLGPPVLPARHSSGKPFPGFHVQVLRNDGKEAKTGELGNIVCKLPLPPGFMSTLYRAPEQCQRTYFERFPGYYDTMDAGMIDADGYVYIMARTDDVINVAGHRLSTSALEEVILEHPDIADAAVVGVPDKTKGQLPLALYVLQKDVQKSEDQVCEELIQRVRNNIGPVAAFRLSAKVRALPRTRSGKTARKSIAELAAGKQVKIPCTIEDASVYPDIKMALQKLGYAVNAPDPRL